MTPAMILSVPLGIAFGLGLWTLLALVPRLGAPRLAGRVAPYLVDLSAEARSAVEYRPSEPASVLAGLAAPAGRQLTVALTAMLGGDDGIARRLRQAGSPADLEAFRSRQLLSTIGGSGAGVVLAVVLANVSAASGLVLAGIVVLGAAVGLIAPEQLLARAARSRQARISTELPTVLEFLTLSLSAGESILDALRRVARTGTGELAREFGRVVAEVNTGMALPTALSRCAATIGLPALTRTIDQLVGALERGTPLAEVLLAQAQDSRDDAKRQLLEAAGRKEVAMLVPLVFLILPVTIAFAIFPGLLVLQLGL
ncbi:MAG: type II secretion system F family protein [Rhodoglobus sp.]